MGSKYLARTWATKLRDVTWFLAGMTAEVTDEINKGDKIEIMMVGTSSNHVTRMISAPILVQLQQTDLGIDSALRIKSADRTTSLLHLRSL